MSDGKTAGVLWGTDHEELGSVATLAVGERAGIANTRGRYPKTYRYLDPNEDTVAAVAGPRATLLVCADGHHGRISSHAGVQAVLDAVGADPPAELDDGAWLDVFTAANDAILAAKEAQPASETVLMAALVSFGRLSFASIGDGALVACRPGAERGRQLNRESMRFLGAQMNKRAMKNTVQRGTVDLDPDLWVVAITDGLSEFIAPMRPADVVPRVLALSREGTAEAAAVALVDTACSAGAGDNVAVALVAP